MPSEAPVLGTVAVIWVGELTVKLAATFRSVTELAPVKFVPLIVTFEPTGPLDGLKPEIVGAGADTVPQLGNLNEPMRVFHPRALVDAKYSFVYQNVQSSRGSTFMLE